MESEQKSKGINKSIFIVHGHDTLLETQVELLLTLLELNPIILHKQPHSGGTTIIERFEHFAEQCDYAIVLLTPDDVGAASIQSRLKSVTKIKENFTMTRARQNVIFEMGYFFWENRSKTGFGTIR